MSAPPSQNSSRRPSLADVARRAGVAVATASYALRAHPKIPEATRLRVQAAAEALDYRVNATVGRLMAELRSDPTASGLTTLAWINVNTNADAYSALPWLQGWLRGARARADQLGYRLEEFWLGDPMLNQERLQQVLKTRSVPGLLIAPTRTTGGILKLDCSSFSVATMARTFRQPRYHQAAADDFFNTSVAFDKLRELGYRRIGFFSTPLICEWNDQRQLGAFLQRNLSLPPDQQIAPLIHTEEPTTGFAAFRDWVERWQPDALISPSRNQHDWLIRLGKRVPEDVGVVHLNLGTDVAGWAGINPQIEWIAASSVDMLIGQIHRHEVGIPAVPKEMIIKGLWVQGSTVRSRAG